MSQHSSQVVLAEVVESERGANYIKNLHEVYAVFRRIKTSFEESSSLVTERRDDLEVKIESVEKHWAGFKAALGAAENGSGGGSLSDFCGNASTSEVRVRN